MIEKQLFRKNNYIWIALGISVLCYMFAMLILFNIPTIILLKFIVLNIISVFLPGLVLASLLNLEYTRVGIFCTSYILGYAFIVVEYFLSEIFDRRLPFLAVTILIAVISAAYLVLKIVKRQCIVKITDSDSDIIEAVFLIIFIFINTFAYSANYLGVDVTNFFVSHPDMVYWTNNTTALKLSWPADNLFMDGDRLYYHYFSSIAIAFLSGAYNIDVFTMSFPLYSLTKAVIMVGAVWLLLECAGTKRKNCAWVYMMVICTTGLERLSCVSYVTHMLCRPFGFDIGYAYAIVFMALLVRQWRENEFKANLFWITLLIWGMCVGAKAPIAAVMLLFAGLICLFWMKNKKWKLSLGYGVVILVIFFVICKFCVGIFSAVNIESLWTMDQFESLNTEESFQAKSYAWELGLYSRYEIAEPFCKLVEKYGVVGRFMTWIAQKSIIFVVTIRSICINPFIVFGACISLVVTAALIRNKSIGKESVYLKISLFMTALFGIVLGIFVDAGGSSEMYFLMTAMIPLSGIIVITRNEYLEGKSFSAGVLKTMYKAVYICMGILLIMETYKFCMPSFTSLSGKGVGAVKNSIDGIAAIYHSAGGDYSDKEHECIRGSDVEALAWIRENTNSDSLIMTDKAVMMEYPKYYYYGLFCERQQYLEGTDMLGEDRKNDNEVARRKEIIINVYSNVDGAIETAIGEGVDYIVQTTDVTPDFKYNDKLLELVKSTDTMNIYRVIK